MERQHPLRAYRARHGLSQTQLAERLNTTKVTVSRIETGDRAASAALLKRIAEVTGGEVMPNDILMFPPPADAPVAATAG
jgi:transcriptional regulator with XRE-family HTH domain